MLITEHKAFACVVRPQRGGHALLVFDHVTGQFEHPLDRIQIPKGTIDRHEEPQVAALRELEEESGVTAVRVDQKLGTIEYRGRSGPTGQAAGRSVRQLFHAYRMTPTADLPARWQYKPRGDTEPDHACFSFRWLPLDDDAPNQISAHQACVAKLVLQHLRAS